jgi:tetratricopeptide (TPR) repeat protein
VEGNLKALFWITRTELRQLTRFSPDFWAFRHKVVEFFDLPSEDEYTLLQPSLDSIHHLYTTHSRDFQTRIAAAERAFSLGCRQEAILKFRQALRKYKHETSLYLRIAESYLSLGQLPAAARNLRSARQAGNRSPDFGREVDRLLLAVKSAPASIGGFSDRMI